MAKKSIDAMSVKGILNIFGCNIQPKQLQFILKDINSLIILPPNPDGYVKEFMLKNQDKINKEKLILCIAYNYDQLITNLTSLKEKLEAPNTYNEQYNRQIAEIRDKLEKAKELLCQTNVELPIFSETEENMLKILAEPEKVEENKKTVKFYTVNDLLDMEEDDTLKQRNVALVEDMKANPNLMNLLKYIVDVNDFEDFLCYYSGSGTAFKYLMKKNAEMMTIFRTTGKGLSDEEIIQVETEEYENEFQSILEKYSDKFDMEKLLLVIAYRAKYRLEQSLDTSLQNDLVKVMQYADDKITNDRLKVKANMRVYPDEKKREVQYSAKKLHEDVSRILEGKYYFSRAEISMIKRELLCGNMQLNCIKKEGEIDILNLTSQEKRKLIEMNPANFEHLLKMQKLDEAEIQDVISYIEDYKLSSSSIENLCTNELISKRDMVTMYMRNNIDLQNMLDYDALHDLKAEITVEELMQYYAQMKEDEEKSKDFERYGLLFKQIKMKGQAQEVQAEIQEQIVEEVCKSDSEYEDFKNLYKFDLLPIQTLIEWNDKEIVYDLISKASLKPKDVENLLAKRDLTLEEVDLALQTSDLSDGQKVNYILSCFKKREDELYLFQSIKVSGDLKGENQKTEDRNENKNINKQQNRQDNAKENILNPRLRWELISLIDEDYTSEMYDNGVVEFNLPNLNGGTIIMEKMLKNTTEGVDLNYGTATFWMSQEEFYRNKEKLIIKNKVNQRKLVDMKKEKTADKTVHIRSWGRNIMKKLNITIENGYTEERIQKMNEICAQIEEDYERQRG